MLSVSDSSHSFRKILSIKKPDAMMEYINYTQKRFSLCKLTETKKESFVVTFSLWRN